MKKNVLIKFTGAMAVCLFELIAGILLLIDATGFTAAIMVALGMACILLGISNIITYFRTPPQTAQTGQKLMRGLAALIAGCFSAFRPQWFINTFPVLTVIYGFILMAMGLYRIQQAADILRVKKTGWQRLCIGALVSVICAGVIFCHPFSSNTTLWVFTGVSLICLAVLDAVSIFSAIRAANI